MSKQDKILLSLFTLFFVTLFISQINVINLIITGLLVIYSFTVGSLKEKITLLKNRKFVQWAILFFVFLIFSVAFSDNGSKGLHYLKLRIPLFIFPVSIGLLSLSPAFKQKVLSSFAFTTVVVCIACFMYGLFNYIVNGQIDALYNDNFTSLLEYQSVYIALVVNFAIFIIGYQVVYNKTRYPVLMTIGGLFLLLVAYLLGSRINMGILAAVALGFGFYYLISKKKMLEIATLSLGLLMASLMVYKFQPQMLNRFKELIYNKYEYSHMGVESHYGMELTEDQWNGANFRLAAWRCGWEIFTENPVIGVGLGDKKDVLFSKYEQKDFRFAIETNKNVHNNYLDILYSLGIVGFVLFLIAWIIMPTMQAFKDKDWLALVFVFTLACVWITEIHFDRSLGGMVAGFFVPLMLLSSKEE